MDTSILVRESSSRKWVNPVVCDQTPTHISCPHAVCELDLVFSLHKSLLILFEMFIGGMLCESSKRDVLKAIVEAEELVEEMTNAKVQIPNVRKHNVKVVD